MTPSNQRTTNRPARAEDTQMKISLGISFVYAALMVTLFHGALQPAVNIAAAYIR